MESNEVLIERIDGNVRRMCDRLDEHAEEMELLAARVGRLERLKDRSFAWAAGAGATIGFVLWVLGLAGCAAPLAHTSLRPRMEKRPVRVLVDETLPECELTAVLEATKFWLNEGATLNVQAYDPDGSIFIGDIYILDGDIPDPGVVGLTRTHSLLLTPGRPEIVVAFILLDSCAPLAAAHEIGHALGLGHRDEEGALMKPAQAGAGWVLSERERDAVGF